MLACSRPGNYKTSVDATKDYCSECPVRHPSWNPSMGEQCLWVDPVPILRALSVLMPP